MSFAERNDREKTSFLKRQDSPVQPLPRHFYGPTSLADLRESIRLSPLCKCLANKASVRSQRGNITRIYRMIIYRRTTACFRVEDNIQSIKQHVIAVQYNRKIMKLNLTFKQHCCHGYFRFNYTTYCRISQGIFNRVNKAYFKLLIDQLK